MNPRTVQINLKLMPSAPVSSLLPPLVPSSLNVVSSLVIPVPSF